MRGHGCDPWYDEHPHECGAYDDAGFTARQQCCSCQLLGCVDDTSTSDVRPPRYARVTVAQVEKNLLAVSDLTKMGHEVVFRKDGSFYRNVKTGKITPIRQKNGVLTGYPRT